MGKQELIDFEAEIKELFLAGEIRAPIHLVGGNEDALIELFQEVKENDWVFSTHRSHYHALLKGVPAELVKAEILKGKSIHLNFPEYRFFTSAIVGGILPIAVGIALSIKLRGGSERVWAFVGDMAAETGIFYECASYQGGYYLPLTFVIEDNGKSVNTPTQLVWPEGKPDILRYKYESDYPHQGCGKWVSF